MGAHAEGEGGNKTHAPGYQKKRAVHAARGDDVI